jgi:hypothetical protein
VQINAVQQRPGDAAQIILNLARRTARFAGHLAIGRARCCLFATAL